MNNAAATLEHQSYSIVALGNFNPAIFHPQWFAANGLIPEEELEEADIRFITKKVAAFGLSGADIQVEQHRLGITVSSESTPPPIVVDFAIGILTLLEHTPILALGFNLDMDFMLPSIEEYTEFGHRVAPKSYWTHCLVNPRTYSLSVGGTREGCEADKINFTIEPSGRLSPPGVSVNVNQHYQMKEEQTKPPGSAHNALRIIREDWPSFITYARDGASRLIELGLEKDSAPEVSS